MDTQSQQNIPNLTAQFSICLLPTPKIVRDVRKLRRIMPSSPYRDDRPHVTLLRRVSSPTSISDDQLRRYISKILRQSDKLPLTATVKSISNRPDPIFKYVSSLIILRASDEMIAYRNYIISELKRSGYNINFLFNVSFMPHISLRLGVPIKRPARDLAESLFREGDEITFVTWCCLRNIKVSGKLLAHEILPFDGSLSKTKSSK